MQSGPLEVKVWGDFACFTRPEFTAERVSYEVMTPSAARGVLEAIFWKPEMRWRVLEIQVLNPVRRFPGVLTVLQCKERRCNLRLVRRNAVDHLSRRRH